MPEQAPEAVYSRRKRRLGNDELATWRAFLRAHAVVTRRLERSLAAAGLLTLSELDVLIQLAEAGQQGLRLSDLADRVLITKSGITRLVDRLIEDGLLERRRCADDRRVHHVSLTASGRRALRRTIGTHLRDVAAAFSDHVGAAEAPLLRTVLERIARQRDERSDGLPLERRPVSRTAP